MEATRNFFPFQTDHYLREIFDLLTLVNQSYQALGIGIPDNIHELRWAIEDVDAVKKLVMEKQNPADIESLGLAASLTSTEELDTFGRMVSFFHKKKPVQGIPWTMFTIEAGHLLVKEEAFQDERKEA